MNFVSIKTKNNIPLYVSEMPSAHTVACGVFVRVGSRDEASPEEWGLTHAFEHMLFQGTKEFPSEELLSGVINEIGGYINAFTSKERTFFMTQVPYKEADKAIKILSEQLQNSLLRNEDFEKERRVILQEFFRKEDNPAKWLGDKTWSYLYKDTSLEHSILGTEESIRNLNYNNLKNFYDKFYRPENFIFIVAGNIKSAEAEKIFEKYFIGNAEGAVKLRSEIILPAKKEREINFNKDTKQAYVDISFPVLNASLEEKINLSLFASSIGRGQSSPLASQIRNKMGLCYSIGAGYYPFSDAGIFQVHLETNPQKYKEAISAVFQVMADRDDEENLKKAKSMQIGEESLESENPLGVIQTAASYISNFGRPYSFEERERLINDVTVQGMQATVKKYLSSESALALTLLPK